MNQNIENIIFHAMYKHICYKPGYRFAFFQCIPLGINSKKAAKFIQDMLTWKEANWQEVKEAYRLFGLFVNIQPEIVSDQSGDFYISYIEKPNPNYNTTSYWADACNLSIPDNYFLKDQFYFAILRRIASWTKKKYASGIKDYYNYVKPNTLTSTEFQCLYDYLKADDYLTIFNKYGEKMYKEMIGNINPYIYENQFIRESISVIENETYKMFRDFHEDPKRVNETKQENEKAQNDLLIVFENNYKMMHNIRCEFTF